MKFSSIIKEKKDFVLDESKFHVRCAYFVQHIASCGCSWFTGILDEINEKSLRFTIWDGNEKYIDIDELMNPENNYSITLLVPTDNDDIIRMVKQENSYGYDRYIGK